MKDQGGVVSRRNGNTIFYRVADLRILRAIALIREVLLARIMQGNEMLERA